MRILFVVTRADTIAGAQVHVAELGARLLHEGHDVLVVTGEPGPYHDVLGESGVPVRACPALQRPISARRDLAAAWELGKLVRGFRPDLISTHSAKAGILGRLVGRSIGIPTLYTAHGWAFSDGVPNPQRLAYRIIERACEPLAERIICVSEYDRLLAVRAGMSADRLVTIHNGRGDIEPWLRASPTSDRPRVLMIGRFGAQKDHRTLFEATARVPGFDLELLGDGEGLESARRWISDAGLGPRVTFLGLQKDVAPYLARASIFALISNWEGFPRSTIEAMRAGLPAVVSDVGGAAEAVHEGATGFCVPRGDVDAVVQALATLVDSPELRLRMGAAGRLRYEREFTFEQVFQKTLGEYRRALTRLRRGRHSDACN